MLEFTRWVDRGDHDGWMGANQVQTRWEYRVRLQTIYLVGRTANISKLITNSYSLVSLPRSGHIFWQGILSFLKKHQVQCWHITLVAINVCSAPLPTGMYSPLCDPLCLCKFSMSRHCISQMCSQQNLGELLQWHKAIWWGACVSLSDSAFARSMSINPLITSELGISSNFAMGNMTVNILPY